MDNYFELFLQFGYVYLYYSVVDDYLDMFQQFGYIYLFTSVFPFVLRE